jgi:hypothetical protein
MAASKPGHDELAIIPASRRGDRLQAHHAIFFTSSA